MLLMHIFSLDSYQPKQQNMVPDFKELFIYVLNLMKNEEDEGTHLHKARAHVC